MKYSTLPLRSLLFSLIISFPLLLPAQTTLSGIISHHTTWTKAGSPYIIENTVTVRAGVTLTINPGVIVKFNDHYDHLDVLGRLDAQGTSLEPIIFTSIADDAHGGDTNADGNLTKPGPDQWGAIWFKNTSSQNIISHAWIGYGGGYATSAMINVYDTDLQFEKNIVAYSAERGIFSEESNVTINSNQFIDNGTEGIYFYGLSKSNHLALTNNTFTDNTNFAAFANFQNEQVNITLSGNTSTGSSHNGLGTVGTIAGNMQWRTSGNFPFIIWDDVTVLETGALSIYANSVVKFNDHYDDIIVNGSFRSMGTSEDGVYITSLADDTYGGDTNGDASATTPEGNQWGAIWLNPDSDNNLIQHTFLGYGGGYATSGMINVISSEVDIDNSTIAYSAERGVFSQESNITINSNNFMGNATEGIYFNGLSKSNHLALTNNTFTNNTNFAAFASFQNEQVNVTLSGNTSTGSSHNGFATVGTIAGNMQWKTTAPFPFIVWDDITVLETGELSLYANTVVKFNDHYDDIVVNGSFKSKGLAEAPVFITSLADDNYGGDTNGDADATEPAGNQWGSIWLNPGSTNNLMHFTFLGYGGGYATSAIINIYTSDADFLNCTISTSAERGVYAKDASPDFQNCNFVDNATDGIFLDQLDKNKDFILENNAFTRNTNFAVLASLSEEESNITLLRNAGTGGAHDGFAVRGTIAGQVDWTSNEGFPFIIWDDLTINKGGKLSFAPGSTVKFNDHYDDIIVNGTLEAMGTALAPIVFTTLTDDSFEGDTNSDGVATLPAGDQWGAIWLHEESSANRFAYTYFGYGGGYATSALLNIYTSDADFMTCTFVSSAERGVYSQDASPIFYDCNFIGNATEGIYFNRLDKVLPLVFENNDFIDNANFAVLTALDQEETDIVLYNNTSTGSSHNGFAVAGTIAGTAVWTSNTNFPFIIWDDLTINQFAKLTLSENSTVKFNDHYDDIVVNGSLQAAGLEGAPVTFTALADDSVDGDTNGDGDATVPAPDQWGAIWFNNTSTASGLNYSFVGYGGGYSTSAMINILQVDDVTIQYSDLMGSAERAVLVDGAYPTLDLNRIYNNNVGIFTTNKALPILRQNDIYDNLAFGIQNGDFSVDVDAWNTWWGDPTGPEHAVLNPGGLGNPVSDHVLFQPWMNQSNTGLSTGVDNLTILPFAFENIIPNPFIDQAQVSFRLKEGSRIRLDVFNANGQLINQLLDSYLAPGQHLIEWNTKNLPAGYYWLRLRSDAGQIGRAAIKR